MARPSSAEVADTSPPPEPTLPADGLFTPTHAPGSADAPAAGCTCPTVANLRYMMGIDLQPLLDPAWPLHRSDPTSYDSDDPGVWLFG